MGKTRRCDREVAKEKKLAHENKALKREVSRLRKMLARIDLDRYDTVKETVEEHNSENQPQTGTELLENLKKTWLCNDCRNGHLEIFLYSKMGSTHYYRKCSNCPNRTKSQKYSEQVKGIIKKLS